MRSIFSRQLTKYSVLLILDAITFSFSIVFAGNLAREPIDWFSPDMLRVLVLVVVVQLGVLFVFGLYKQVLRYASVNFLITLLKVITISWFTLVVCFYVTGVKIRPQTLFLDWLLSVFLVGGVRLLIRYSFEFRRRFQKGRRVLIYGAGDMGAIVLRQLTLNRDTLYSPVGFIDDNSTKRGAIIQGVRVLGTVGDIESVAETENVEEVVIAIAGIDGEKLRMLVKRCRQRGIVCRILPSFSRLLEMDHEMRDIELSDLMRRAPKDLDIAEIQKYVCGKNVLVTGAAGSIGSEIVRQCLRFSPNVIAAVDQSEFGLYSLKEELGHESVKYVLGDVKQEEFVDCLMKCHRPDIIFHAAAYKHVPLLEENVSEAIRNNIGCTKIMAFAADKYNVKSFVLISTDKAVKPSSIMGATKRICELLIQNFNRLSNTEFVAVRFGNVLGSSGSVVPKFMQQIKSGKPVTVTHPDATRYFMLIDEAVQLVLQAAAIGRGGEIFILDMGMPVKIVEMAEDLIYLMGRQPYKDIPITFVGLRPGEKVHEELFNDEIERRTKFKEITIGKSTLLDWELLSHQIDKLLRILPEQSCESLTQHIKRVIADSQVQTGLNVVVATESSLPQ